MTNKTSKKEIKEKSATDRMSEILSSLTEEQVNTLLEHLRDIDRKELSKQFEQKIKELEKEIVNKNKQLASFERLLENEEMVSKTWITRADSLTNEIKQLKQQLKDQPKKIRKDFEKFCDKHRTHIYAGKETVSFNDDDWNKFWKKWCE